VKNKAAARQMRGPRGGYEVRHYLVSPHRRHGRAVRRWILYKDKARQRIENFFARLKH
jgi:hypothetical protein